MAKYGANGRMKKGGEKEFRKKNRQVDGQGLKIFPPSRDQ